MYNAIIIYECVELRLDYNFKCDSFNFNLRSWVIEEFELVSKRLIFVLFEKNLTAASLNPV